MPSARVTPSESPSSPLWFAAAAVVVVVVVATREKYILRKTLLAVHLVNLSSPRDTRTSRTKANLSNRAPQRSECNHARVCAIHARTPT